MRELFTIDKKNYKENGTIGTRPSVRGIIIRGGKIAMMHSLKYDYYKLPGGGIEAGETYEETLVREVREESGLVVKVDSIQEFGYVRRIEKGKIEDIFMQDNYYYLCEAEELPLEQNLDDYEEEEQFTLEWVTADQAVEVNQNANHGEKENTQTFHGMIERENRVLELVREYMGYDKDIRLYNVLFPFWMLLLFPQAWLIVLPGNFIIDSLVLLISMLILKIGEKKQWYKKYIFKIYAFGMLSDIVGSAYMLLMMIVFQIGNMGDELYLTIPALIISAVLIFVFNYFITFRKIDKKLRFSLSLIFAVVTAPYTFLIPSSWLY